jgi:hypothetical protein
MIAKGFAQYSFEKAYLESWILEQTTIGLVWWLSGVGLLLTVLLIIKKNRPLLILTSLFITLSQSIIIINWNTAAHGTLINVILLLALIITYHKRRFHEMIKNEIDALFHLTPRKSAIVTTESLHDLPQIVQRWLIRSKVIGRPKIRSVHLKQKGLMRMKPDANWIPMQAEQFINAEDPAFIWNAVIQPGLFVPIQGRDKYFNGNGNMLIKAMYTIPIADSSGTEITQGSLMRYLAEIIWFPSAALSKYIKWEYVSETSARAIIENRGTSVSGLFHFSPDGDIKGFEGMRFFNFDHQYSLKKWTVAIKDYREFDGVRLGYKSELAWQLASGEFNWLKVELTDIKFNEAHNAPKSTISFAIRPDVNAMATNATAVT